MTKEEYEEQDVRLNRLCFDYHEKEKRIAELEKENAELKEQIEKMKSDVMANIKWADKNCDNMWQKLVKMWNQWEIKENDIERT